MYDPPQWGNGLNSVFNSHVRIDGNISSHENAGFGIVIYGGSSLLITGDGTTVIVNANGVMGSWWPKTLWYEPKDAASLQPPRTDPALLFHSVYHAYNLPS